MSSRNEIERAYFLQRLRLGAVLVLFLGLLLYLGAALHHVQIADNTRHASALERHSMRRIRLPAVRGRILDRNGAVLAGSHPDCTLSVYVEELRRPGHLSNTVNAVDAFVDDLSAVIGRPRQVTHAEIENHIRCRRPLALAAFHNLGEREIARYLESDGSRWGADLQTLPSRSYPHGDCAAAIIGFVGRRHPESNVEEYEDYDFYLPDLIGRDGIEKVFDHLSGRPGGELVRIDAMGYKFAVESHRPPVNGRDVQLTIDLGLQRRAEELLAGRRGAIVVVDVRSGEIPVLATSPRFDLSLFAPRLSPKVWEQVSSDPDHPLLNRATSGCYPPGSTIKPFVALAALDAGIAWPGRTILCEGVFQIGETRRLSCTGWHGNIDLPTAIERSCNTFFCQLGSELGHEPRIRNAFASVGLGTAPALEIPAEGGLLPTTAWKHARRQAWLAGDTANLSIGQGELLVTPLQMALATAAIANGGDLLAPRLVVAPRTVGDTGRRVVRHIPWKASSLATVREGMRRTVHSPRGTGRRARVHGLTLAGKTGTAQYGSHGRRHHAWMIAYAPFESPEYAMAVVIEDGESGGHTAAPVVRDLFAALYGLVPDDGEGDLATADLYGGDAPPAEPEYPEELEELEPPDDPEGDEP